MTARVQCPKCKREIGLTRWGKISPHFNKRGAKCSGGGMALDDELHEPIDTTAVQPTVEQEARVAVTAASKAWQMIHQVGMPAECERAIRALVLNGHDATSIVGAITIAACKARIPYQGQWDYAMGVLRNHRDPL